MRVIAQDIPGFEKSRFGAMRRRRFTERVFAIVKNEIGSGLANTFAAYREPRR